VLSHFWSPGGSSILGGGLCSLVISSLFSHMYVIVETVVVYVSVEHCRHAHKRSSFMSLFGSTNTFDPMG